MSSLVSILSTCGVLLMDSTIYFDPQLFHDHSKIIAKEPWQFLDGVNTPDCVFIVVDLAGYNYSALAVNKSRADIKILLMVNPEDQTPSNLEESVYDEKFDAIVVYFKTNKSLEIDSFYDSGKLYLYQLLLYALTITLNLQRLSI